MGSRRQATLFFSILLGLGAGVGCTPSREPSALPKLQERSSTTLPSTSSNESVDQQMQNWSRSLKKSHEIFREVWAHIWEDRLQNPMSVFLEIERLLHAHRNPEDGHFRLTLQRCPERASEVELEKRGGQVVGAVFYRRECRGASGVGERVEMARVRRESQADEWTFYAENMNRSAGPSLALLREKIHCRMLYDEKGRLGDLNCQNLGQNRDSETHLVFSEFQYRKSGPTLVQVEGKKYKLLTTAVCDNPRFCTRLTVPLEGRIEIFDDRVSQVAREERKRAFEQKEREEELLESRRRHEEAVQAMNQRIENVKKAQMTGGTHVQAPPVGGGAPGQVLQVNEFGQNPSAINEPGVQSKPVPGHADGMQVMEFDHAATAAEMDQRAGYRPGEGEVLPRESQDLPQR